MKKQISLHKGTAVFVIFFLAFIFFAFAKKEHHYSDAEGNLFINPKDSSEKVKDADGNSYKTVTIGKQIWMAENLKATTYQNGDKIIYVEMNKIWRNFDVGAYSYYDNDKSNIAKYGMIYNIEAIADDRGICPKGYRIPTNADWDTLVVFLGGEKIAGGKLKSKKYWNHPNTKAKDTYGFGALPGGTRGKDGTYNFVQFNGYYWTHLENDSASSCVRYFDFSYSDIFKGYDKSDGFSCRCIKDK